MGGKSLQTMSDPAPLKTLLADVATAVQAVDDARAVVARLLEAHRERKTAAQRARSEVLSRADADLTRAQATHDGLVSAAEAAYQQAIEADTRA